MPIRNTRASAIIATTTNNLNLIHKTFSFASRPQAVNSSHSRTYAMPFS